MLEFVEAQPQPSSIEAQPSSTEAQPSSIVAQPINVAIKAEMCGRTNPISL